ncbi:MAG: TolC family protein [Elusimicrobia bacterium]|nr:TolC family protein [Elusimicrobiota bacterium]
MIEMNRFLVLMVLASWPASAWAQGEPVSSGTITLNQVLDLAERASPEILAARKKWDAAAQRVRQAATPDKPRLDIERMYAPSGMNPVTSPDEKSVAVTQDIPFPSTLYLRRGVAAKDAAMAEQSYRAKLREVVARARSTYAMLYLAHRSLEIFKENIDLMRRFAKVAESKYASGHAPQSDALKAQVELTKMLNMNVILNQDKESGQAMLNALLGRDAREPLGTPAEPALQALAESPEELESAALSGRPELREAQLGAERGAKSLALARSEFLPDFMLQVRRRTDPMRGTTRDAIVGLSLPLWFWKPAAMVAEAKAEKEMSEAELAAMRLMTLSELRSALVRAQTSQRLAETYRTSVLPQGEAALKVAEAGYQAEKTSFLDLLDAQRSLLNFRLEYYQYVTEHQVRVAELERAVGRRLTP